MKCADARTALLTAEPAELDGVGDSALAAHIRSCGRCRATARAILDEQEGLAAALANAGRPARTAEELADAVLGAVAAGAGAGAGSAPRAATERPAIERAATERAATERPAIERAAGQDDADAADRGGIVVRLDAARRRAARRARDWRVWAPVALAAALAAVLLLTRPRYDWQIPGPNASRPTQVAVSAPVDRNVVVFGTRNPDIKVIWFYGKTD
ncbi:MAG TPA: hypothetical protein VJ957_01735 [Longimicrobiales bacterium]|nr:hypothetical protein [Longimicrobiales bacterium]